MNFVDTHCHIQEATKGAGGDPFMQDKWRTGHFTDPEALVTEAVAAGVSHLICVGCTLPDSVLAVELAGRNPYCYASVGIHPHEAKDHVGDKEKLRAFRDLLSKEKVVAIGECGLDYYYDHSPREQQLEILRFQLELAAEHRLPVIFHVREAFEDFWPVFDEYAGLKGVIHSFTADRAILRQILDRDLYVGLNGIITFTSDQEQLAAAKAVPPERLLLETDAPFLTPKPFRGTICQPKHVVRTAEFLSNLRGESLGKLATMTTRNAQALFNL